MSTTNDHEKIRSNGNDEVTLVIALGNRDHQVIRVEVTKENTSCKDHKIAAATSKEQEYVSDNRDSWESGRWKTLYLREPILTAKHGSFLYLETLTSTLTLMCLLLVKKRIQLFHLVCFHQMCEHE